MGVAMMLGMLVWGLLGLALTAVAVAATVWLIRDSQHRGTARPVDPDAR